ncbi:hypothetical protein QE152_g32606 [Popillia japonica]|uniref:Uncharacterized protein n=1 Tax=Popillia japonica TaxID=7064 RepID=A0AAW1IYK6_POPJA
MDPSCFSWSLVLHPPATWDEKEETPGWPNTRKGTAYILPTQFYANYKEEPLLRKGLPYRFRTITQLTAAEQALQHYYELSLTA